MEGDADAKLGSLRFGSTHAVVFLLSEKEALRLPQPSHQKRSPVPQTPGPCRGFGMGSKDLQRLPSLGHPAGRFGRISARLTYLTFSIKRSAGYKLNKKKSVFSFSMKTRHLQAHLRLGTGQENKHAADVGRAAQWMRRGPGKRRHPNKPPKTPPNLPKLLQSGGAAQGSGTGRGERGTRWERWDQHELGRKERQ